VTKVTDSTIGLAKRKKEYKEKPTATPKAIFLNKYMKKIPISIQLQVITIKEKLKGCIKRIV
jgi:hypothetical protein